MLRDKDRAYRDGTCADFMGEYQRTTGSHSAVETREVRPLAPAAQLRV